MNNLIVGSLKGDSRIKKKEGCLHGEDNKYLDTNTLVEVIV